MIILLFAVADRTPEGQVTEHQKFNCPSKKEIVTIHKRIPNSKKLTISLREPLKIPF
jgi:hypothetical protein